MLQQYCSVPVIPVAVVKTEEEIYEIGQLCMEFFPSLELAMRSEFSYKALEIILHQFPRVSCAAATILSVSQAKRVLDLGVQILVSPGSEVSLLQYAQKNHYSYIPGVMSPTDVQQCLIYDYKYLKFFPAAVFGGVKWLKAMASVYDHLGVKFMPLGGINLENVKDYLKEPNVFSCGGTWLCSRSVLDKKDWVELRRRFKTTYDLLFP